MNNTDLLSETLINDLNTTMEPPDSETDTDHEDSDVHISDDNEQNNKQQTINLDDSMTLLKEAASAESKGKESTHADNNETISRTKTQNVVTFAMLNPQKNGNMIWSDVLCVPCGFMRFVSE